MVNTNQSGPGEFCVALLGPIDTRLRFATNFLILSSSSGAKLPILERCRIGGLVLYLREERRRAFVCGLRLGQSANGTCTSTVVGEVITRKIGPVRSRFGRAMAQ